MKIKTEKNPTASPRGDLGFLFLSTGENFNVKFMRRNTRAPWYLRERGGSEFLFGLVSRWFLPCASNWNERKVRLIFASVLERVAC